MRDAAKPLLKKLAIDVEAQAKRLAELENDLNGGDVGRGHLIFNGKAVCITCHKMGYRGGKMGPDLTRIGRVRTERDLLEAIAFPSASFVRGYEPMLLKTKSGEQWPASSSPQPPPTSNSPSAPPSSAACRATTSWK